jgi:uncharacterized membrane protein
MNDQRLSEEANETARLEAFSDGVFAIAITLLVLEIAVPHAAETDSGHELWQALLDLWPSYVAFVTSFLTILIMWINHHIMFKAINRNDHFLFIFNGLLLLCITFIPFPTAVLAEHLNNDGAAVAAAFYAASYTVIAVFFNALWRYAVMGRLLRADVNPAFVRTISWRYTGGVPVYAVAMAAAPLSPHLSVAIVLGLDLFFVIPLRTAPMLSAEPADGA